MSCERETKCLLCGSRYVPYPGRNGWGTARLSGVCLMCELGGLVHRPPPAIHEGRSVLRRYLSCGLRLN